MSGKFYTWKISGTGCATLTKQDKDFIRDFNPAAFFNDTDCSYWAFDTKLPSGKWLENIALYPAEGKAEAIII